MQSIFATAQLFYSCHCRIVKQKILCKVFMMFIALCVYVQPHYMLSNYVHFRPKHVLYLNTWVNIINETILSGLFHVGFEVLQYCQKQIHFNKMHKVSRLLSVEYILSYQTTIFSKKDMQIPMILCSDVKKEVNYAQNLDKAEEYDLDPHCVKKVCMFLLLPD